METLDRIIEMQQKGITDREITAQLQNEGISASEINSSFNHVKIKNAVSPPESITAQQPRQDQILPQEIPEPDIPQAPENYQPQTPMENFQSQPEYEQTQETLPPQEMTAPTQETYTPTATPEQFQQEEQNYYQETPQAYSGQDYYAPQEGISPEAISEIAEQVTIEKLDEYKDKVGDIASFKNNIQDKVNDIDDRLKRIENNIDKPISRRLKL